MESWTTTVQNADGVIKYGLAEYFGLKFQIKHNKVRLQGSLHKYRNTGRHNYDDFTAQDVEKVVQELSERFEIDTATTEINNVEFGVNVVLPFPVKLVLDNLIVYKGEPFQKVVEDGMSYYQCKRTKFIIKIYDKGKQYKLPENVLRFEIKVTAMQYLETKGIRLQNLSDLLNIGIYEPLGNILLETFDNILFGDNTLNENGLNPKELETYLRGSNPKAWKPQRGDKERKRLQRLEVSFKDILERHRTGVNFRGLVSELIRAKSLELSQISQNSNTEYDMLNMVLFPYSSNPNSSEKSQFVPNVILRYSRYLGHSRNTRHSTDASLTTSTQSKEPKIRKCASCRKILNEDQKSYCSERCNNMKNKRNLKSNDRNNFKNRYKKFIRQPPLFDISELLKLNDKQREWINSISC
ncbi:MAG: hypothetical protein MUF58_04855 [Arcicella sp.]|nr:hypothetical protein [Arcicella sp.]